MALFLLRCLQLFAIAMYATRDLIDTPPSRVAQIAQKDGPRKSRTLDPVHIPKKATKPLVPTTLSLMVTMAAPCRQTIYHKAMVTVPSRPSCSGLGSIRAFYNSAACSSIY